MAAYPIMKINTQMNHFMLSPPSFLKFWKEIYISSQNVLDYRSSLSLKTTSKANQITKISKANGIKAMSSPPFLYMKT